MTIKFNSYDWLWLSLTLLPLLSIAFLLPLSPQDYWWYLRLGQDILRTGVVPSVDIYSFTRAGEPFFYQAWLAAILFFKTYQTGGISLTFFLRGLVIAVTYALLWFLAREAGAGPRLASLVTILAALVGSSNWSFRPQLLTYPLFMLTLTLLIRWSQGRQRGLWLLPVLSVLWVNLHGSYPLLFVLGGLALVFGQGEKKRLGIIVGIGLVALLINPHGFRAFWYVPNMLTAASNQLSIEWAPMVNRGWQANLFFAWLLAFAPLTALAARKKLALLDWIYFLTFGWLALSGLRYVIWFSFILAVQTAALLAGWNASLFDRPIQIERRPANLLASMLLLVLPLVALPGVRELWWQQAPRPYHSTNPVAAAEWLSEHPELEGPLLSDFSYSSYLIFALPSRPVWIGTRFELYPAGQWKKYTDIMSASPHWQDLLDGEGINLIMLSTTGEPALITALQETAHWCQGYLDEDAVVFYRAETCP
jgi:hypothetical protein